MPYELLLGIAAAAFSVLLPLKLEGWWRWLVPVAVALVAGTVVGVDELRGEGLTFALIEGAAVVVIGTSPLAIRGVVWIGRRLLSSAAIRGLTIRALAVVFGLTAVGLGFPLYNAHRLETACRSLVRARATRYRLFERRLDEVSWVFRVRCRQDHEGEEVAQTCRWWSPGGVFGWCWMQNKGGIATPATESGRRPRPSRPLYIADPGGRP